MSHLPAICRFMRDHIPSWRDLFRGVREGAYEWIILKAARRHGEDAETIRIVIDQTNSVILKRWSASSLNACLRAARHRRRGASEYRALVKLQQAEIPAPRPIEYAFPFFADGRMSEVVLLEDLGNCETLCIRLHEAVKADRAEAIRCISNDLIRITGRMIDCGILDSDHRMSNFLIGQCGTVYRIDLENAVISRRRSHDKRVGEMVGALVSSYAWLARPNPEWTRWFCHSLLDALALSLRKRQVLREMVACEIRRIEAYAQERVGFEL